MESKLYICGGVFFQMNFPLFIGGLYKTEPVELLVIQVFSEQTFCFLWYSDANFFQETE